jgi:cytochrome c2
MKVTAEPLPGEVPVETLRAHADDGESGIHKGETLGFRCEHCSAVDETLRQIIHEDDCPLVGQHGRDLYGEDLPSLTADIETPELDADHPITIVSAGWTDDTDDVHNGEAICFRCDECGNSDETLFEIVHDESCSLAGRYGWKAAALD